MAITLNLLVVLLPTSKRIDVFMIKRIGQGVVNILIGRGRPSAKQKKYHKMLSSKSIDAKYNAKSLSQYKLTIMQKGLLWVNRCTGLFKGSCEALLPDIELSKQMISRLSTKDVVHAWNQFNDPQKAYVLIFRNPGNDCQHAAMVIGSTQGHAIDDPSNYASWTFDDTGILGPLATAHFQSDFKHEFTYHGHPEVIELSGLDIKKMQKKWEKIQKYRKIYSLIGFNCSTLVSSLIKDGLPRSLKNNMKGLSPKGFWTPKDVRHLSTEMKPLLEIYQDNVFNRERD